jgi:cyanophycinase
MVGPMPHTFLIGGGRDRDGSHGTNRPFAEAVLATGSGAVALLVLDEGDETDAEGRAEALRLVGLEPEVTIVAPGRPVPRVGDVAAVYVAGGLTPGYQTALCPDPSWLPEDVIYGGFSAGAAIAAEVALVGGWRMDGLAVCNDDNGEDLDEVEIRPGLALLEPIVDVHCSQWGNLGRLAAVVAAGDGRPGWGIDEHTTLELRDGTSFVHGLGAVHRLEALGDGRVAVAALVAGDGFAA